MTDYFPCTFEPRKTNAIIRYNKSPEAHPTVTLVTMEARYLESYTQYYDSYKASFKSSMTAAHELQDDILAGSSEDGPIMYDKNNKASIDAIFCLGLGSLAGGRWEHDGVRVLDGAPSSVQYRLTWTRYIQLVVYTALRDLLAEYYIIGPCYVQDPDLTLLDKEFLEGKGSAITTKAKSIVTRKPVCYAPFCMLHVIKEIVPDNSPLLYLGTWDLSGRRFWERPGEDEDLEKYGRYRNENVSLHWTGPERGTGFSDIDDMMELWMRSEY